MGHSIGLYIVDTCGACEGPGYENVVIDFSEGAFKDLNWDDTTAGRINLHW
jgi:hypothetical protein